ncbi:Uncharacterised protein [Corynebacterium imitans]|uniref:Secreted protein n=1 Tax=Corynebacterium imitans TaxID=156978 RepID=A0A076NQJ0_9CORY|nr:hypothetical protein [Corynebacterium imitans]AIJ33147.1 hypothetical protein CIMIT_03805 [Corynebacterium imitans]SNV63681.1 Uncharacterised protein [Corynebacterium imitans]
MKLFKIAIATTTAGAITMGALAPAAPADPAAPAAPANTDRAYSGSAWGLYNFLVTNIINGADQLNGGANKSGTEKAPGVMLSSAPFILLLFPLQLIAEAEVRLLDQLGF